MLRGSDLKEWRNKHGYTQEMLQWALGLRSRQTIITWEKSDEGISKTVELALLALEFLPEKAMAVSGAKFDNFKTGRPRHGVTYRSPDDLD